MFTAHELEKLNKLKYIQVVNANSKCNYPSTVELAIPQEVERDFVNFMELLDLKIENDISFDRYTDKLTKTLGLEKKLKETFGDDNE